MTTLPVAKIVPRHSLPAATLVLNVCPLTFNDSEYFALSSLTTLSHHYTHNWLTDVSSYPLFISPRSGLILSHTYPHIHTLFVELYTNIFTRKEWTCTTTHTFTYSYIVSWIICPHIQTSKLLKLFVQIYINRFYSNFRSVFVFFSLQPYAWYNTELLSGYVWACLRLFQLCKDQFLRPFFPFFTLLIYSLVPVFLMLRINAFHCNWTTEVDLFMWPS